MEITLTGEGGPLSEPSAKPSPDSAAPQPPRPGIMSAAADGGERSANAPTPEEQQMKDLFVRNGLRLMSTQAAVPTILRLLEGQGNPVEGLASASAAVVIRLVQTLAKAGKRIPPDTMFFGALELFEELADLASEAGVHDFRADADGLETALFQAINMIGQTLAPQFSEFGKAQMAAYEEADRNGELAATLREIVARDQGRSAPAEPQRRGLMPGGGQQPGQGEAY